MPTSGSITNEEASARLWLSSGLDASTAPADLIRATDHFKAASVDHPLKHVMLGVDLAILGQDAEVYDHYAAAIRLEYGHVPVALYQANRCKALQHLQVKALANQLYLDGYFAQQ